MSKHKTSDTSLHDVQPLVQTDARNGRGRTRKFNLMWFIVRQIVILMFEKATDEAGSMKMTYLKLNVKETVVQVRSFAWNKVETLHPFNETSCIVLQIC